MTLYKEKYYVIQLENGTYVSCGVEWYEETKNVYEAHKSNDLYDIKKFKSNFDEETKGNFGKSYIIEINVIYKRIK